MFERPLDLEDQRLRIKRFLDELIGAVLGGGHRHVDARVAGEDDDLGVRPFLFDQRQQIQPIAIRQLEIEEDDVLLFTFQLHLELGGRPGLGDVETVHLENFTDDFPNLGGVIHR